MNKKANRKQMTGYTRYSLEDNLLCLWVSLKLLMLVKWNV
jgi:hypothetical protein